MLGAHKLLILGGIALALLGMGYGMWYAVLLEHRELGSIGGTLAAGFTAAAERNPVASEAALKQYRELQYAYDRHVDVHGHWIGLAMLMILLGIAYDRVEFSERVKMILATTLLMGSLLFPLGVLFQTFSRDFAPRGLAVMGSALVITSLGGMTLGFARKGRSS